ncbi:MAG: VIT and VWA domain-containing protein [Granulosicoccus sp.]
MKILHKLLKTKTKSGESSVSRKFAGCLLLVLGVLAMQPVSAAGLMSPRDGSPELTLAEQHVSVVIQNGFAITEVEQVFRNPHQHDLTAVYSFPVPEQAAVGEFTYWIDGQPVHAEVLEKQAARALHEQQKQVGNESALAEKDKYRTFDVEVSPIRAGQDSRIRLVYLQKAHVDHSMGRYVYPLEEGGVDEARKDFWLRNDQVSEAFSFQLRLRSAYPVDAMRVTNGQAQVQQLDSGEWEVLIESETGAGAIEGQGLSDAEIQTRLAADEVQAAPASQVNRSNVNSNGYAKTAYTLDRDIVVYWRLAENLPGAVDLVTYKQADSSAGTFMLTLTPGIDLAPITEGRDWLFVLDTSGSMQGKFAALIDGVRRALSSLNPADRFKVILFSDKAKSLSHHFLPADQQSVQDTLAKLDRLQAGGGTNLFDGLQKAVKSLDNDRTTAIVLVTDGVANVGATQMNQFLKLMDKVDVRLFTAVMGNSANRPLLEGLTKHSEGFAVNVSNDDDMVGLMLQMTSKVTHEALHNVRIDINGIRTRDLTPAEFSRVYRGEQLIIMGKYSESGTARLKLKADISGETKTYESELNFAENDTTNPELERLWAFAKIEALQEQQNIVGETSDTKQAITDIALDHGLVTDYTSLIVVRNEIFEQAGIDRRNANRVERERLARKARAAQSIASTRQDAASPAFSAPRHTSGNGGGGGGSFGLWMLAILGLLSAIRIGLGLKDKYTRQGIVASERKLITEAAQCPRTAEVVIVGQRLPES